MLEILSYCKNKKITLSDYINKMYKEIGYYYDKTMSFEFDGVDAINKANKIMDLLRNDKIEFVYKEKIDYLNRNDNLKTNAIKYIFDNNTYLVVRPSGTEPKIKLYFESFDKNNINALNKLEIAKYTIINMIKNHID